MQSNWMDVVADTTHEVVPFVRPVTYVYKYRHSIQKYWIDLLLSLKKGQPDILVTGTAGAGKSVLMSHYHGEANQLSWRTPGVSPSTEIKPIPIGDWTQIVHVIPGQHGFERTTAFDVGFSKTASLKGVIHVVDWGYTAVRDDAVRAQLINVEKVSNIHLLRARSLKVELDEFKSVCNYVRAAVAAKRGPKWLVIAVNKVDLFIDGITDAQAYYELDQNSDFVKVLNELLIDVGRHNLKVLVLPVCSMPAVFEWNGEEQRPQVDSVEHQRNFMRKFVDEIGRISQ